MSAISLGRIVTKIMGREAGRRAVVTRIIDQNFAEISGPFEISGVKRRRVNISHIDPTEYKLALSKDDTSDETLIAEISKDSSIKELLETRLT
ncbi:MAG: 50S ribosomal protein L14e [Candidatus Kariarchaeaceae archaeon]